MKYMTNRHKRLIKKLGRGSQRAMKRLKHIADYRKNRKNRLKTNQLLETTL